MALWPYSEKLQTLKSPKPFAYHFSEPSSLWKDLFFIENLVTTYE